MQKHVFDIGIHFCMTKYLHPEWIERIYNKYSTIVSFYLLLSLVGYTYINSLLNDEISEKMKHQLDSTVNNISKTLIQHTRIAESTARVAGVLDNSVSKDTYVSILSGVLGVNDEFGAGVWFEPYVYEGV